MAHPLIFVTILCLLLAARADAYDGVRCSTECPITGSPKFGYTPGLTYAYHQHGESNLRFENVENANTRVEWTSKVELSMLTPCDVAITIKEFQMNGKDSSAVPEMAKVSERPLMMAILDGRVQHVCVDPEDDTWSVNAKMSVASYLQNTLSSFSEINEETTITERDIQGKCPTRYSLTPISDNDVQVVKEKDNKRCEDRFYRPSETMNNLPWLNMPLPLEESKSTCQQNIQGGIYTSIECTDTNILKPMYGVYKHIRAIQKATLQFESQEVVDPTLLTFSSDRLVKTELKFDFTTPKKRDNLAPRLDAIAKDICSKVKKSIEPEVAALVYQGMSLLRHAPDSYVKTILDNIRAGTYCPDWYKIEQMYLDAIAFLGESGAVPVMVEEISQGLASAGRTTLYATAMHMMPRPNEYAIRSLALLVTMPHPPKTVLLAAASMVNTYIRQHPNYREEGHVDNIIKLATSKLAQTCHAATPEEQEHAKLLLKALGNVGYFPESVASTVKQCFHDVNVETSVRVAAAQAYRKVPCNLWDPREMLRLLYYDDKEETEIRSTAYLNAIRCVDDMTEMKRIISFASNETNIQVRSLVLTHLGNLQETDSPNKEHLRYLLSNTVLPDDYSEDFRKFSRNTELSYFFRTLGLGAEIDSNLVYSRKSVLPRSLNFNVTVDALGNLMNLAEVGGRIDGFNSLMDEVFGPKGYLMSTPWNRIIKDITSFGQNKGLKIFEHLMQTFRAKRSVEFPAVETFLETNVRSRKQEDRLPHVDLYLRLFGQEVSFASLTSDLKNIDWDMVIETVFPYIDQALIAMSKTQINTARTLPFELEYTIPTMQGIPLHFDLGGAVVLGLDVDSEVDVKNIISSDNPQAFIELIPSLALEIDGFVGFKSVLKHGIRMRNNLHISHGGKITIDLKKGEAIAIKWDLPEKWDIISFKSQAYMLKEEIQVLNENPEDKIIPEGINDLRLVEVNECTDFFENPLGLRFCYILNLPDPIHSSSIPFGKPIEFSLTAEKAEASMEGYAITATLINEIDNKAIDFVIDTPGSSTPRECKAKISYTKQENSYIVSVSVTSTLMEYSAQTTFVNDAENKALEMFWKYKFMNMDDEYAHAFKTNIQIKTSDTHRKFDFKFYYSPSFSFEPESKIFETLCLSNTQDSLTALDITVRTYNDLRNFIELDIEAGIDFYFAPQMFLPSIEKLRKLEIDALVSDWSLHQRISTTVETDNAEEWSANIIIMKGDRTYAFIETLTKKTGTFDTGFSVGIDTTAVVGDVDVKSKYMVLFDDTKLETTWDIKNRKTNEHVIDFLSSMLKKDQNKFSYELKLHIPILMERFDFESHIDQLEDSKYDIIATIIYNEQVLYEIKGPFTLKLNEEKWIQEMGLEITGFSQGPHKLTTAVETSNKKKKVFLEVMDSTRTLVSSLIDSTQISGKESDIKTNLELLFLTEIKSDLHLSKDAIYVNFNSLFFPKESYRRRIKGFYDQDFAAKVIKSDLYWDAEVDELKKISIETKYDFPEGGPLSLNGGVVWKDEPHRYDLKVWLASPLRLFEGHNKADLVWTTPAQQTFEVQALLDKHTLPYDKSSMTALIHFKTIYDNIYEWKGEYNLEYLHEPMNYKVDAGLTLKSPQIEEIVSVIHAYHKKTADEREASFKVDISKSRLTEPIVADISGKFMENSYEAIITFDHAGKQSSIESHGTRTSDEESWLKSGKIAFEANLPFEIISRFKADSEKKEDGSMRLEIVKNDQTYFNIRISQTEPLVWNVRVETPSRTLEAMSRLDSSQPSVQLWTNKENSDAKFELSGNVLTKEVRGTQGTRIEGKISFPDQSKDIRVSAEYGLSPLTVVGSLELDIFKTHEDMIFLTLQGTKKSEGSYTTEMSVSAMALKFSPTIVLDTAMTTSTKGIELHYRYDPAVPQKTIALKYERIVPEEAILSAKLKTPSIDMEISTGLRSEETTHCHGLNLDTHYVLQSQKYEIKSHLCYPAHVEMMAFKKDDDNSKKYYLNAGWKSPTKVELDLHVEKPWENQLHRFADVAGIKAELTSPVTLDLEGHYHHVEVEENMKEIMETINTQVETFIHWWQSIYHQLQEDAASQSVELPVVEADKVHLYFREEFVHIYEDLRKDELIPDFVHIFHVVIDELHTIVTMAHEAYVYANDVVIQIYTAYADFMSKISRAYQSQIMESLMQIRTVLVQLKDLYETNQLTPEAILQTLKGTFLWEKIEELARRLQEEYPQEYQAIIDVWNIVSGEYNPVKIMNHIKDLYPEEWEAVTYIISHVMQDIKTDANNAYRELMQRPFIRKAIEWFLHSFGFDNIPQAEDLLRFLYQLLEETFQLNYSKKEGRLHLVLPLNRPVYSLTTVPYGVSPRLPVWKSFIGLFQTFIPIQYKFFNAFTSSPAIYYGDGSLYTFDGRTLKLPVTPCQYILTTDGYDHVTVRVLPENKYEFGITVDSGRHSIVIDREYKMFLDNEEKTEEIFSLDKHAVVDQRTDEVVVNGRSFYLTVSKSTPTFRLYASAELQGRLEGLMGTLNNFQGDDMMMPNGQLAPDAPAFLKSWQVDPTC